MFQKIANLMMVIGLTFCASLKADLQSDLNDASGVFDRFAKKQSNMVPAEVLKNSKGVAYVKAGKGGILFGVQRGTGFVVTKRGSNWSAPSAFGARSVDFRVQLGYTCTEYVWVLNSDQAVQAFSSGQTFTFPAQLGYGPGPTMQKDGTLTKEDKFDVWVYARQNGFFMPPEMHNLYVVPLPNANKKFYGCNIPVQSLLDGSVSRPAKAQCFYNALDGYIQKRS